MESQDESPTLRSGQSPVSPATDRPRRPSVVIFDVNETLSDLAPMTARFQDVGGSPHLAVTWFAGVLRDGFALTAVGASDSFARIAAENLRVNLHGVPLNRDLDNAVAHILEGFRGLPVHADVPDGVRALSDLGIRLVTLSNGAASVAEGLLGRAEIRGHFERILTVEDAGIWKPAPGAYTYALEQCAVDAEDAMLIAVHPWDIDGASRAGLATAWINRRGGPYPAHFEGPDLAVESITALADQLR